MKITQSFIKAFRKYLHGQECGHIIKHCYVDGKLLPPTTAMRGGIYFEFNISGALPKDKQIPKPDFMKKGDGMTVLFRKAYADANYVKGILDKMELKIIKAGITLSKGNYEGTIDLIVEAQRDLNLDGYEIKAGTRFVIDLKYSGLLNDRWNEMGWMFTDIQKEYHKTQAVQYQFVSGMPFFYLVTDSSHKEKDEDDGTLIRPEIKFIHTPIDEFMVEQHLLEGQHLFEQFELLKTIGFSARPSLSRCDKCPLNTNCKDRQYFPSVEVVNLNTD